MPDKKISALTSLAQGDVAASTDVLPIVDTSATETKKITASALVGAGMTAGVTNVDINSGSIDGTTIGANSAAAGTFTNLTASGTVSFSGATVSNGGAVTTIDINGGTIDATSIGASSASTGAFTTLTTSSTVTLNGGTANGVLYLNGSKVATSGSALTFDGTILQQATGGAAAVARFGSTVSSGRAVTIQLGNNAGQARGTISLDAGTELMTLGPEGNFPLVFQQNGAEGFRLTSTSLYTASGINVGIGTSSPVTRLDVSSSFGSTPGYANTTLSLGSSATAGVDVGPSLVFYGQTNNPTPTYAFAGLQGVKETSSAGNYAGALLFLTQNSGGSATLGERARITSSGDLLVGTTSAVQFNTTTVTGWNVNSVGQSAQAVSSGTVAFFNRLTDDGTIISLRQAGTEEGTISVSGNTVSYNAFAGSHWSQLQDGSKPDILRGTVMESINELCVWPDENNERLPKSKVSDTAGSKKVYGVFMAWDNDWTTTNDMYVTAVGAFICRVNGSVTVQEGDLLESNGDGTARVQADDIIRSSTIGKVTSTVKTHQYADGSYCVPTVLYCG